MFGGGSCHSPPVPQQRERDSKQLPPMSDPHCADCPPISLQDRRNDRDPLPGFRHGEQTVRCRAFEHCVRPDVCKTACRIENRSCRNIFAQQQQRMPSNPSDVDRFAPFDVVRACARRNHVELRQQVSAEEIVVDTQIVDDVDRQIRLAPLQHPKMLACMSLNQFHLYARPTLTFAIQQRGEKVLDREGRSHDPHQLDFALT